MRRTRVYIAGPYTLGDKEANVLGAINAATVLLDSGFAPYVPHLRRPERLASRCVICRGHRDFVPTRD